MFCKSLCTFIECQYNTIAYKTLCMCIVVHAELLQYNLYPNYSFLANHLMSKHAHSIIIGEYGCICG